MRDDLNAALDESDNDAIEGSIYDETQQEVITDEDGTTETATSDSDDGASDASTDSDDSTVSADAAAAEGDDTTEKEPAKEKQLARSGKELASGDSIKPPVGWGPKEREDWSKIPRHLQEKVMARERDMSMNMESTAQARKTHDAFTNLTQQYGSVLSGVMGDTPMETVGNLFSTVANLRMGSPIQKAQIVADLIKDFGVDINTLDSAIVGAAPSPQQSQSDEVQRLVAEQMAPFQQMMGQQNAYQQQQVNQRTEAANTEVRTFSANAEFLGDVRHDMADMIDAAAARGQNMTMEDAYNKACAINPQISAVMAQRKQQADLTASTTTMATKRAAASSLNGRQIGNGGNSGGGSMRDTIADAWDNAGRD
jgi:hypothetical protein